MRAFICCQRQVAHAWLFASIRAVRTQSCHAYVSGQAKKLVSHSRGRYGVRAFVCLSCPCNRRESDVPAALLAEALLLSLGSDGGGFGVVLADLVPAVVVLEGGEVGLAPLGLAPRRLVVVKVVRAAEPEAQHARHAQAQAHPTEARRPRHRQQVVHGQHVRGGEVRAAAQVQPDPLAAGVIHDGAAVVLPLHQERRRPAAAGWEMVQLRGRYTGRQRHQRHLVQRRHFHRHISHARRRRREKRRRICLLERESRGGEVEVVAQLVIVVLLMAEEPGHGHVAGVEARVGLRHGCEAEVGVGGCWRHGGAIHQQPTAHHGWMKRWRRDGKG
jgi:hypothetical protein